MSLLHDLHSHSQASDGSLTPDELVRLARNSGVDVLALTDHDDTTGLAAAEATAAEVGLILVPGIELSVTWGAMTVHIVGLNINRDDPRLQAGLERLRAFRDWRAKEIGERLEKHGVRGAYEGAAALAKGNIISRTHFAHYLVSQGFGKDVQTVFRHFLRRNKPGHVPGQWASLDEAVEWIRGAGGQAVIAHPGRYDLTATKLGRLITEFKECGGEGLEVVSGSHTPDECQSMGRQAVRAGLFASAGSDFHNPATPWIQLGRLPALPPDCTPIWESDAWRAVRATSAD